MPLPIWLIPVALKGAAVVAGAVGVGSAVHGAKKMKDANDTMESAKKRHERNVAKFEKENETTSQDMDKLGKLELEILHSFGEFSDVFEQIKNKPKFENYTKNGISLPQYDGEKLKEVSVGAGVLLGGLGGAGLGAASGFAAAGATTAAVMALGTASTGTAIASLSGAAATNATLAALGGGAIAAGGGGIALGTAVLGGATLGVGLLVGGIIFNATGCKLSEKADEAWDQMKKAEEQINKICSYLKELRDTAKGYQGSLIKVNTIYNSHLDKMKQMIEVDHRTNWYAYSDEEQTMIENSAILTQLLYSMCKVQLVIKTNNKNGINKVNTEEVTASQNNADTVLHERGLAAITTQAYSSANKGTVVFEAYCGVNKTAVAYLINNRTGISVDLANQLLSTGGEVSADDPKEFAEQLKSYGIKASAD